MGVGHVYRIALSSTVFHSTSLLPYCTCTVHVLYTKSSVQYVSVRYSSCIGQWVIRHPLFAFWPSSPRHPPCCSGPICAWLLCKWAAEVSVDDQYKALKVMGAHLCRPPPHGTRSTSARKQSGTERHRMRQSETELSVNPHVPRRALCLHAQALANARRHLATSPPRQPSSHTLRSLALLPLLCCAHTYVLASPFTASSLAFRLSLAIALLLAREPHPELLLLLLLFSAPTPPIPPPAPTPHPAHNLLQTHRWPT